MLRYSLSPLNYKICIGLIATTTLQVYVNLFRGTSVKGYKRK